jgi:hypothetical protein
MSGLTQAAEPLRLFAGDVMERKWLFRHSRFFGAMAASAFLIGSCLNPIDFNPNDFKLNVNVSGSIKIEDVSVMWLINRTKTVDVTSFTINRAKAPNETDAQYAYPKNFHTKPLHGESLASYHAPAEIPYSITVVWANPNNPTENGIIGPFDVQFPRAQDYKYFLYRTIEGNIVLVNEDKMRELPPNPDDNYPDPQPSSVNAQTLVVLNVTADQDIDLVEFVKGPSAYIINNEPRAKDQEMVLLAAGSYDTRAFYTRNGTRHETPIRTSVVTRETGGMALRTNFLYFYKTNSGSYDLSQYWPPLANDAASDNNPEDALTDKQGILEIVNNAVPNHPHALIARININGLEYPSATNTTSYFAPQEPPRRFIVDAGVVHVSFRPTDQTYYGQVSIREIQPKKVTVLSYVNDLGNPFVFPEDTGKGTGLIRITNNSTAVVTGAAVYDRSNVKKFLSIPASGFNPPKPINYGKVGLAPVVGTNDFPLTDAAQLIQVILETPEETVVVERVAAVKDQIVDIVISENNLKSDGSGGRYGSKVTVKNQTTSPTKILGLYVYNKGNEANLAVYPLDIANPNGQASLHVLSTIGLPIVQGGIYGAKLIVHGNNLTGIIDKDFSPDGQLYSTNPAAHEKTITLTQADLQAHAPGLIEVFVPVTGINLPFSPYPVNSFIEVDPDGSNPSFRLAGSLNLNHTVTVAPSNATQKSPIVWTMKPGGGSPYVSLDSGTGVLTVTGIAPDTKRTVTVEAAIANAAGSVDSRTPFNTSIQIALVYQNIVRTQKVQSINLASGMQLATGQTLDLVTMAALNPNGANINGLPITVNDLTWAITNNGGTNSTLSGSTLTVGPDAGTVTVRATLAASKSAAGSQIQATQLIAVVNNAPVVSITGMSMNSSSLQAHFYTRTENGIKTVYDSQELPLASYVVINPSNATKQSPMNWSAVSGVTNAVELVNFPAASPWTNNLRIKTGLSSAQIPANGSKVGVTATIPGAVYAGGNIYSNYVSPAFEVTLVEHHSRLVQAHEFSLVSAAIPHKGTINLSTLARLPADAMNDNIPITAADLAWEIIAGGTGSGSLSGAVLTGSSPGTLMVRATLSAEKNFGTARTAVTTVTVQDPPVVVPSAVTLRIISMLRPKDNGEWDSVKQIAIVPVYGDLYNAEVYKTGYTRDRWVFGTPTGLYKAVSASEFDKFVVEPYRIYTLSRYNAPGSHPINGENEWADVTVPVTSGMTGFYIYFIEGDNEVRGYVNPGKLDPPIENNYKFYVRLDYVVKNYMLDMGVTQFSGHLEANPAYGQTLRVIPISYEDWNNVPSIMVSAGVGKKPRPNYAGVPVDG